VHIHVNSLAGHLSAPVEVNEVLKGDDERAGLMRDVSGVMKRM
jgi:hypothetical protein